MPTLHLICGLPCSGKTTYAKRLEQEVSALRLTPDEWHIRLFGHDVLEEESGARHDRIEALLWKVAARVLALKVDVILDFGFWGKGEREDYRTRAAKLGANSELHYLDAPNEVLLERLDKRNAELPEGAAYIPEAKLREWISWFQPPTPDELKTYDPR